MRPLSQICAHNRDIKVCIEYKINEPRVRCQIGNAGEFLKSVLAVEPESFLSILETMPPQDRSGNAVAIRVHSSVIPALLIKEQAEYNAALANPNSFLQIPDGVLSSK